MIFTVTCVSKQSEYYSIVCTNMDGTQVANVEIPEYAIVASLKIMISERLNLDCVLQLVLPDGTLLGDVGATLGDILPQLDC